MSLEIHYDQLQNAITTFNTGHTAFEQAHSLAVAHAEDASDALADAHQAALGELDTLLGSVSTRFFRWGCLRRRSSTGSKLQTLQEPKLTLSSLFKRPQNIHLECKPSLMRKRDYH